MNILVFTHHLYIGGTQLNAIDLSIALRDVSGHDITVFATPGVLSKILEEKGIRFIPAPHVNQFPSLQMMRALDSAIRDVRPDVIHVWDWWQCMPALYAAYILHRIPMVVTDMTSSGKLLRSSPRSPITTFGTPERVELARSVGFVNPHLLVPPIDVIANSQGYEDSTTFRQRLGLESEDILLVTVSRLDPFLKRESLIRTVRAVGALASTLPLRLAIVGGARDDLPGSRQVRDELLQLADFTNRKLACNVVFVTGEMQDPRAAYSAADIVIGMGGSALRGMSFSKPVIIVGENGFADVLTPDTSSHFLYTGIYGVGVGDPDNQGLISAIRELAINPELRTRLGGFSRRFVVENFSLATVSSQLEHYCVTAHRRGVPFLHTFLDGLRTTTILLFRRCKFIAIRFFHDKSGSVD